VILCSALVALALPLSATATSASEPRVVVSGVSPLPPGVVVVNKVITTSFDLALTQTNQAALTTFIASLANTTSSNFHHYLTPTQYARQFGASDASVNAVRAYFTSFGLNVGSLSTGRNILHASGTTTNIARAFDATVVTVRRSDGTLVAHLTSNATVPAALANDVTAVAGLSAVQATTPSGLVSHSVATPSSCASAGSSSGTTPNTLGGYTLQQQAQLYGFSAAWLNGDTGVGQTIAIYELAQYNATDTAAYFTCYGLTPKVTTVNVDGGPTSADNAGNAPDEATLDLEEASALAPGAAIEVYQGTNAGNGPTDIYSQIASDNTATIVSTSWGICEPQNSGGVAAEQAIFEEMAAQGQTVVAASGDSGSSDCQGAPTSSSTPAVDDPASQPYVTGVGGLSVTNIAPLTQTVWNDNCTSSSCGSSGGGVSTIWTQPVWQVAPGITTTGASGGMRMVPDLSVMGDPATGFIQYYTGSTVTCQGSCNSGWNAIGGTSIGAPLISALVAVAAQSCNTQSGRLGFINPSLYPMAATGFNDVTTGSNDLLGVGKYSAGPGYDMASGLGSPNGAAFIAGLCPSTFSSTKSSFAISSNTAAALSTGPTVNATLRDTTNNSIANMTVNVTATAPTGLLNIDNDHFSAQGLGSAVYQVTSDATGAISFSISSTVAQSVSVNVTYQNQVIYANTLTFTSAIVTTSTGTKPGSPTISKLSPLVAGFALTIKAPSSNGGRPITSYQYSINGGARWTSLVKTSKSINVTKLKKNTSYIVEVRAINAIGPSSASAKKKVVTRS
jgi:subtilase family serine protease